MCRVSCKWICRTPARADRAVNIRVRFDGSIGVPNLVVKIRLSRFSQFSLASALASLPPAGRAPRGGKNRGQEYVRWVVTVVRSGPLGHLLGATFNLSLSEIRV